MTQHGPRNVAVLGATGSIGASTLDLIRRERGKWRVVALTANGNAADLARLAREFSAELQRSSTNFNRAFSSRAAQASQSARERSFHQFPKRASAVFAAGDERDSV